jgi:hypothetical protein
MIRPSDTNFCIVRITQPRTTLEIATPSAASSSSEEEEEEEEE